MSYEGSLNADTLVAEDEPAVAMEIEAPAAPPIESNGSTEVSPENSQPLQPPTAPSNAYEDPLRDSQPEESNGIEIAPEVNQEVINKAINQLSPISKLELIKMGLKSYTSLKRHLDDILLRLATFDDVFRDEIMSMAEKDSVPLSIDD